jgi:hypothetical protein
LIARLPDWQSALSAYILSRAQTPFRYGQLDCGLFVADAIQAMTGVDVAAPLRGRYTNRKQAFEAIKALCGSASMEALANYLSSEHGLPQVRVLLAQRGDPVVLRTGQRSSLGIVDLVPGYLLTPYRDGLLRLPLSCASRTFHIGQ